VKVRGCAATVKARKHFYPEQEFFIESFCLAEQEKDFFMRTNYSFNEFSKKITFLQEIPHEIASQLSVDEFYFPDKEVDKARRGLEQLFGQYVMSYKGNVFRTDLPIATHLCANYKGAGLTEKQIECLNFYETKLQQRNIRFVIYKKPLTKIALAESPFFN
jgi:hypothetical protein